jgi:hypothetical protein
MAGAKARFVVCTSETDLKCDSSGMCLRTMRTDAGAAQIQAAPSETKTFIGTKEARVVKGQ